MQWKNNNPVSLASQAQDTITPYMLTTIKYVVLVVENSDNN